MAVKKYPPDSVVILDSDGNFLSSTNPLPIAKKIATATTQTGNVSVAAASTEILATNANRNFAELVNDSNEEIYLSLGGTAEASKGIRLNPLGGTYSINAMNLYTGAINGICASGSKNITVVEG